MAKKGGTARKPEVHGKSGPKEDAQGFQELHCVKAPQRSPFYLLAFSRDGSQFMFREWGTWYTHRLDTGEQLSTCPCPPSLSGDTVSRRATVDTHKVVSFDSDKVIVFDQTVNDVLLRSLSPKFESVARLSVDRDASHCLVYGLGEGEQDSGLELWDLRTGQLAKKLLGLGVSPDGQDGVLAYGIGLSDDAALAAVFVYLRSDPKTGVEKGEVFVLSTAHGKVLQRLPFMCDQGMNVLRFSEQARRLVACYGGRLAAWDVETGRELLHLEMNPTDRHLNTAAFVPGTNLLAVGTERNGVQFWDLGTREMVRHCQGKNASTQQIAISPDGRYMMTWGNTGRGNPLRVWRLPEWS